MGKIDTVLVTGAAGCIGSNLVGGLLDGGCRVFGVDNLSHGLERNIKPFFDSPNFVFEKGDARDRVRMNYLASEADAIVHLAGYKIPRYGGALETLRVNADGTESVLDAALKHNRFLIMASTSDVYGKSSDVPLREDGDLVLGPSYIRRWAYAASKLFDEHLCLAYAEERDLPMCILRFFGGYGRNQSLDWWGGPQAVFISAILKRGPITVHGDGKQTRTFTHVSDQVQGILLALGNEKSRGEVFNIGSTEEISLLALAELIKKLMGETDAKIDFIPYESFGRYEDVRRRVPDISKAKKILGFKPKIKLEGGLRDTIEWQKKVMGY